METNLRAFRDKFLLDNLTITETQHWIWSVRPVHSTLGSGILSLRRYCEKLSYMTLDESADLSRMVKIIEGTLYKSFSYDKMNYLMLMMVDSHLHYHVIPRYSSERTFCDLTWTDQGWPALPVLSGTVPEENVLIEIRNILKSNLVK